MDGINGITNLERLTQLAETVKTGQIKDSEGFAEALKKALSAIVESEKQDDSNTDEILSGNIDNIASQMVDMVEADIALQFTMQVRNKIVEAYQEIMRMQI